MISIRDLFVKHTYKHNSHIKLMYIYLPVGKRAYFEIYSERFVFNKNTCFLYIYRGLLKYLFEFNSNACIL